MHDPPAGHERRLDADDRSPLPVDEGRQPGGERLERHVSVLDDLGGPDHEDAPPGAVGGVEVVDLEGDHCPGRRRRQLRTGCRPEDNAPVEEAVVDGEDRRQRADRDPDAPNLTVGEQAQRLGLVQDLETFIDQHVTRLTAGEIAAQGPKSLE